MGLLGLTELALTILLERALLSLMGLPGRTELVLTDLKIDLQPYLDYQDYRRNYEQTRYRTTLGNLPALI